MKLLSSAALSAVLLTSTLAQQADIRYPPAGFRVSAGQSITVQVERAPFQSSATEVAIVLGYKPCGAFPCIPPPDGGIGTVLYSGPFNPQYTNPRNGQNPHQNYTVTIPEWATPGTSFLSLVHYSLIGAGLLPWMESKGITLTVV
ncbi:hypothetical protein PM082_018734 [Marasmius tenuissimus]|nr:hypothetical protein PM082_018734 [Marasmius tenuissimus]